MVSKVTLHLSSLLFGTTVLHQWVFRVVGLVAVVNHSNSLWFRVLIGAQPLEQPANLNVTGDAGRPMSHAGRRSKERS